MRGIEDMGIMQPTLTFMFGEGLTMIHFLVFVVVLDLVTGYMKAFSKKSKFSFKSAKNYQGLMKKLGIFIAVMVAAMIDVISVNFTNQQLHVALIFTCAMIIMELLSIVENLEEVGLKVPFLTQLLHRFNKQIEDEQENKNREDENNV
ncbi:phage holin family protein [Listeria booriae]|uniref:phage holin family protein n=1 Tax=Listeria booriae TaxID=1552123 RepID=UPI00162A6B24|nr:phage holin family protein [Listeria booriae]MBC1982765.1 phage holin family protein [Listeria booriae]